MRYYRKKFDRILDTSEKDNDEVESWSEEELDVVIFYELVFNEEMQRHTESQRILVFMKINKETGKKVENIFDSKKSFILKKQSFLLKKKLKSWLNFRKLARLQILKRTKKRESGRHEYWDPDVKNQRMSKFFVFNV